MAADEVSAGPDAPTPAPANMRKSASTVLIGTAAANGIAWLMNLALATIFDNATFGTASLVIAVASIFIGVSTMRLEVLSQRVSSDEDANVLLSAGLGISVWWGVGLTVATGMALLFGAPAYWLGLGAMVTMGSLQLIGAAALTRGRRYGRLTWANMQQAAGMSILQVGLGLISAGVASLLVGFAAARLVWLPVLRGVRPTVRPWRGLSKGQREFARTAGTSALINASATQISAVLVWVFYTPAQLGNYAMALRILAPLAVLSQAVAAAAIGEVGSLIRANKPWYPTVRKTMLALSLIGGVLCAGMAAFGYIAEPWLFAKYPGIGPLIAVLVIGSWLQFAVSPFSQLLNVTESHRSLLVWDISRLLALSLAWIIAGVFGAPLLISVLCYSLAMGAVYVLLWLMIRRAATA